MKSHPPYIMTFFIAVLFLISCNEDPYIPTTYGSVQGIVLKDWNDEPVIGARITTSPSLTSANTDSIGEFIFDDIETGEYTLTASKDGYDSRTEKVVLDGEETLIVKIYLSEEEFSDFGNETIEITNPAENETNLPIQIQFGWSYKKNNYRGVPLVTSLYTVNSKTLEEELIAEDLSDSTFTATGLRFNTTYFWYLSVKADEEVLGKTDMFRFKTQSIPKDLLVYCKEINQSYEILAYDSVTGLSYQLTDHPSKNWFPKKAPFGDLVAFISNRNNENHIYTMLPDGSDMKRITQIPIAGYHNNGIGFAWSPDAGYIIYPNNDKLIKIHKEGYDAQILATAPEGRHFGQCDWSVFGDKIVVQTVGEYIYESEIYIMNTDGSGMTLLVDDLPGRTESPCISLDGSEVYFTNDITGLDAWDGTQLDSRIFKIESDGTGLTRFEIAKESGENIYYTKLLHGGFGLVYSIGIGNSTKRKIYEAKFTIDSEETSLMSTEVIDGDMPDW
jgi:TolB protein